LPLRAFVLPNGRAVTLEDFESGRIGPDDTGAFPPALLYRMLKAEADNPHKGGMISVTSMLSCLRKTYFERTRPYDAPPILFWYPYRGTILHTGLQTDDLKDWICERRFSADLNGHALSGQIDAYHVPTRTLWDYKTAHEAKLSALMRFGLPKSHIHQVNGYRWLLEKNGLGVDRMRITYLSMMDVVTTGETGGPISLPSVPVLPFPEIETLLADRAMVLRRAFDLDEIPIYTDADTRRWLCRKYCPVKSYCDDMGDRPDDGLPPNSVPIDLAWEASPKTEN